jgi:hypothetical protein
MILWCLGLVSSFFCRGTKYLSFFQFLRARSDHESGYIIKVLPKRITVGGTLFYEAEHCTINYSKKRFRVGFWFGKTAYSNYYKLGVKVEKTRLHCPECGSISGPIDYLGDREFVLEKDNPSFVRTSFEPYTEDGKIVWVVKEVSNSLKKGADSNR